MRVELQSMGSMSTIMGLFRLDGLDIHLVRYNARGEYGEIVALMRSHELASAALAAATAKDELYRYRIIAASDFPIDDDAYPFVAVRRPSIGGMEILGASLNMLIAKGVWAGSVPLYPASDRLTWQHGIRVILESYGTAAEG